jgi:hypothetical protein
MNGLKSVIRTTWIKTTGRSLERGDKTAIKQNQIEENILEHE